MGGGGGGRRGVGGGGGCDGSMTISRLCIGITMATISIYSADYTPPRLHSTWLGEGERGRRGGGGWGADDR